jgi:uncharacterized membrane protein YdbT with pleckstrin-like domain
VVPAAVIRTAAVVLAAAGVLFLETYVGLAGFLLAGLPLYVWTLLAFGLVWAAGMAGLLVFYASNSYMLRRDGLEVRRGIIRLHSFVVTPSGFGDLLLYQGIGGRIFGYGDLTVNSQGNRQTKLSLVRSPYKTAETIRDVMGKPIFRAENHV